MDDWADEDPGGSYSGYSTDWEFIKDKITKDIIIQGKLDLYLEDLKILESKISKLENYLK